MARRISHRRWRASLALVITLAGACGGTPRAVSTEIGSAASLVLFREDRREGRTGGGVVDVNSGEVILFTEGLAPLGWSPFRSRLLYADLDREILIVSGPWGDDPRPIFEGGDAIVLDGRWLNEETILVVVGESALPPLPLHVYAVSVTTGAATLLEPDVPRYIEAVSPSGSYWLEFQYPHLDIVRLDGSRRALEVGVPIGHLPFEAASKPSIAILPNADVFAFVSCSESTDASAPPCALYLAEVFPSNGDPPRRLPDHRDNLGIESLRVSPDGRLLAFVSIHDNSLVVVGLGQDAHREVIHWGQTTNAPSYVWSPSGATLCAGYFDPVRSEFVLESISVEGGERHVILGDPTNAFIPVDWALIEPEE